jgi:hypothetical protein
MNENRRSDSEQEGSAVKWATIAAASVGRDDNGSDYGGDHWNASAIGRAEDLFFTSDFMLETLANVANAFARQLPLSCEKPHQYLTPFS